MALSMYTICFAYILFYPISIIALSSNTPMRGYMNINMPDVRAHNPDSYICTAKRLNLAEAFIVQYEPDADSTKAHHMLLFGCSGLHNERHLYPGYWDCAGELCQNMTIIYGWSSDSPSMKLPPDVGQIVGGNSSIKYLVLQMHYIRPFSLGVTDNSGLKLRMTNERQRYVTGVYLLMAQKGTIPALMPRYYIDVNCKFPRSYSVKVFAYRIHTHKLGTFVFAYKYLPDEGSWNRLMVDNPQKPQAFYPVTDQYVLTNRDIVAARCAYNSSGVRHPTSIGSSVSDEMCNLFLMYYTDFEYGAYTDQIPPCLGIDYPSVEENFPAENNEMVRTEMLRQKAMELAATKAPEEPPINFPFYDKVEDDMPQDPQLSHSEMAQNDAEYKAVPGWFSGMNLGQITAVTYNNDGNVVIFHRGDHIWNDLSFDNEHVYLQKDKGPIKAATIVIIDAISGRVLDQWGTNLFYLPHGLTIDKKGQYWITDVALHQVMCFTPDNKGAASLKLGKRFHPGNNQVQFCKPTSVAIYKDNSIYIADGYCNSRIVKYNNRGLFEREWGKKSIVFDRHPPIGTFNLPHKIIYLEDQDIFCVADRENARIQCLRSNGEFLFEIYREEFGGSLFSVSYAKDKGYLYAICGEAVYQDHFVKAFVFNISNQKLVASFAPDSGTFTKPHDIVVSSDGEDAYVCEIGPNVLWKFQKGNPHKSTKKVLTNVNDVSSTTIRNSVITSNEPSDPHNNSSSIHASTHQRDHRGHVTSIDETENFETSIVIMALLGIPILLLVLVTAIIRLRQRGKLQGFSFGHLKGWMGGYRTPHPQEKFNLGTFLNPHKGFDKVSMVESDGDEDAEQSDNEEFVIPTKNA